MRKSEPGGGTDPSTRTVKVRLYVDADTQRSPQGREDLTDELDYASQLLQPLIGVRLAIDAIRPWPGTGPAETLGALAQLDPGDGVLWVIGVLPPLDRASAVMADLGLAEPLGHHVLLRSWATEPETAILAGRIPPPGDAARAEVLAAHRRHKQTVVLLHLLATTLGAIDEADPAWIQHAAYSPKQVGFADRTRDLLQRAIDARIAGAPDRVLAAALAEQIEKAEWGGWVPASRDQLLATLRAVVDAARAGKTVADIPPAALEEYRRIGELARTGHTADAIAELDNLLTAYPGNASLHQHKCELLLASPGVADPRTRAACARVAELAPGDPGVHLAVAEALIRAKDLAGARGELARAEDKIANLGARAPEAWRKLIGIYQGLGALTWTEDALAKAGLTHDPAADKVAQTRARFGLPRGAAFVTPDREAALVGAIRAALDLVYASKFAEAERALATAERAWPGAPGLWATRCDLAFRQGRIDAAQAACARAIAGDPSASWALYLQGVLLLRDAGTTAAGIDKLKRAIAVDPELGQAWRTLGKAYTRGGDRAAFDALDRAYVAKFGQSLPP